MKFDSILVFIASVVLTSLADPQGQVPISPATSVDIRSVLGSTDTSVPCAWGLASSCMPGFCVIRRALQISGSDGSATNGCYGASAVSPCAGCLPMATPPCSYCGAAESICGGDVNDCVCSSGMDKWPDFGCVPLRISVRSAVPVPMTVGNVFAFDLTVSDYVGLPNPLLATVRIDNLRSAEVVSRGIRFTRASPAQRVLVTIAFIQPMALLDFSFDGVSVSTSLRVVASNDTNPLTVYVPDANSDTLSRFFKLRVYTRYDIDVTPILDAIAAPAAASATLVDIRVALPYSTASMSNEMTMMTPTSGRFPPSPSSSAPTSSPAISVSQTTTMPPGSSPRAQQETPSTTTAATSSTSNKPPFTVSSNAPISSTSTMTTPTTGSTSSSTLSTASTSTLTSSMFVFSTTTLASLTVSESTTAVADTTSIATVVETSNKSSTSTSTSDTTTSKLAGDSTTPATTVQVAEDASSPNDVLPIAIGAGVGAPSAIILIIGGICCFTRSRKRRADADESQRDTEMASDSALQSGSNYTAPPLVEDSSSSHYAPIRVSGKAWDDYDNGRFETNAE